MERQGARHVTPKSGDPGACRATEEADADPGKATREYAITAKDGATATPSGGQKYPITRPLPPPTTFRGVVA